MKPREVRPVKAWAIASNGKLDRPSIMQLYDTKVDAELDRIDGSTETVVRVRVSIVPVSGKAKRK